VENVGGFAKLRKFWVDLSFLKKSVESDALNTDWLEFARIFLSSPISILIYYLIFSYVLMLISKKII